MTVPCRCVPALACWVLLNAGQHIVDSCLQVEQKFCYMLSLLCCLLQLNIQWQAAAFDCCCNLVKQIVQHGKWLNVLLHIVCAAEVTADAPC